MWDWLADNLLELLIELAPADTLSTLARLEKRCRPYTADRLSTLARLAMLRGRLGLGLKTMLGARGGLVSANLTQKLSEQTIPILFAAFSRGALPAVVDLNLAINQIEDEGMVLFSKALGRGTM